MKFSYQWIKELVDGLDVQPRELMRLITMKTAECEGLEEVGAPLREASVAEVIAFWSVGGHRFFTVRTERYGIKNVVCSAPNCRGGIRTVYVPVGVKIFDGNESDGMLASAAELGMTRDHSGIVDLGDAKLPVPDAVIEVDNKSLTNRPDLWGHHGLAREVAAIAHRPLLDPVDLSLLPHSAPAVEVEIADLNLCPRYSALAFENVTVKPSPLWLQYRLEAIGLNSINNIVDVTNYVMSAIAQPMHAFDADKLNGPTIFVRPAREGETITALNDERYQLTPSNLVIADAGDPIAIGGVIGGLDTAIGDGTTRIVLESANFQAASVRKTSVALKLRTDASMRFEKSQDPANTVRGLALASALLQEVSPGIRIVGGVADAGRPPSAAPPIALPMEWLVRKLGRAVEQSEVEAILRSLGFAVTEAGPGLLSVAVPSWRATKDITIKDDLVEEVGRMIGYDSITPRAPMIACVPPPPNPGRAYEHRVREILVDQGFTEVYNYSFVTEEAVRRFSMTPSEHLRIANPIAADQELMRSSLLPGIVRNIESNSRHFTSFRLFEIGKEIHKREGDLPREIPHVVAALFAREGDGIAGLFELKRVSECLMQGCVVRPAAARPFEHPQRAAEVHWRGEVIGRLFELHPSLGLDGRAAVLDLDMPRMMRLEEEDVKYTPLRRFPTSSFDLSVVAPARSYALDVKEKLAALAGPALVSIAFVREYALNPEQRSISFRLTVGAADRTLSSDEVGAIRQRVIDGMAAEGYELRV